MKQGLLTKPLHKPVTAGRWITAVGLAALFLLILATRITQVTDHDVFMHIEAGEWILENKTIPRQDPFSWFAEGAPWDDHEWLFQVAAYAVHQCGGFQALGFARAGIVLISLLFLYYLCRLRGASNRLAALLIAVAAIGIWPYNEPRPYLMTPLGLAIFGIALERMRGASLRWICVPPLYMLIWVNSHAGFTSGCILLLLAFAGALAETGLAFLRESFVKEKALATKHAGPAAPKTLSSPFHRYEVRVLASGLLTLAAVLCNPYGWKILLFPFKLVGKSVLMQIIQEWNPSTFGFESAPFYALFVLLGLRAMTIIHRARPADLAAYILFTWMALDARRHVTLFFFVLTPVAAAWLQPLLNWRPRLAPPAAWKALHWCLILAFAAGWMIPVVSSSRVWRFGNAPNPNIFATGAVERVKHYNLKPNMFNGYNLGGYYIYHLFPKYKVFIDGRADVYGPERNMLYAHMVYPDGPEWNRVFREMGINFVLMDSLLPGKRGLIDELVESTEWALVYWDDAVSLFVRAIPEHALVIGDHAAPQIHPLRQDEGLTKRWKTSEEYAKGLAQLEKRAGESPPSSKVFRTLSYIYGRQGQLDQALQAIHSCLNVSPRDPVAHTRRGQIMEKMGRLNEAAESYRAALRQSANSGYLNTRLGIISEQNGQPKMAEKYYARAYRAEQPNPEGTLLYANTLIRRGRHKRAIPALEKAIRLMPQNPMPRELLAQCYNELGKHGLAQKMQAEAEILKKESPR